MLNILLTGVATLDILNLLDTYPTEDSESRVSEQTVRTGGNATNTSIVMQHLGIQCHLLASLADDSSAQLIKQQLGRRGINMSLCPVQQNSSTPTSYITLSKANGSRTIVHYRQLEELSSKHFEMLDLSSYDWLHFEARNCLQLKNMLRRAKAFNKPVSIELEKPRDDIDDIYDYADILMISRPFAKSLNFTNATDCLTDFQQRFPDKILTCTWGDKGAWASTKDGVIFQAAEPIDHPVETLGAGDTFNAGFITSIMQQHNIADALKYASKLAALKCAQAGFDNLPTPL